MPGATDAPSDPMPRIVHVRALAVAEGWRLQPEDFPDVWVDVRDLADGSAAMRHELAAVLDLTEEQVSVRIIPSA